MVPQTALNIDHFGLLEQIGAPNVYAGLLHCLDRIRNLKI